jgi:hypothetical protein
MPIGSFADSGPTNETIVLRRALFRIVEIHLQAEPEEVTLDSGRTFTSNPNLNALIEIVDDYATGEHNGKRFWDRFQLKQNPNTGAWEVGENSKAGYLVTSHPEYGPEHFKNPRPVDENDFADFEFEGATEQRQDREGNKREGTRLVWNSMSAVPNRAASQGTGPGKNGRKKTEKTEDLTEEEAQMEESLR